MARRKFYTSHQPHPLHTAMGAILYCYTLVRPKRPVGREVAVAQEYEKNPADRSRTCAKFGWYGKVNQKSGRFANVPFHFRMNRKGRSSSSPLFGPVGFLRIHTSAFHLLSWLLSPNILEKLSFTASVFWFLEVSFQILISVNPKTLFWNYVTDVFFFKFL